MLDSHQIDSYFENSQLRKDISDKRSHSSRWARLIKIGGPCIAAAIFGLMVIMPNIKKSIDIRDNVTMPKINEMEKLHMEETVFSTTDSKNRISRIVADSVDELEPGSPKVKILNPHGTIPTDNGEMVIVADVGYFDQKATILDLEHDINAVIEEKTTISTERATYDFKSEYGYGNAPIFASGEWGKAQAQSFNYDKKNNELMLNGNTEITTKEWILTSDKVTRYYQNENKAISEGNVKITQGQNVLKTDKLISYFSKGGHKELLRAEAYGNVEIHTPNEKAYGTSGIYDLTQNRLELNSKAKVIQGDNLLTADKIIVYFYPGVKREINYIEALGHVTVTTPKGSAQGNKGVYKPQEDIVELLDDVIIRQDNNFIRGGRAETNLKTSISRITGRQKGERISGIFYSKGKKTDGNKTKK